MRLPKPRASRRRLLGVAGCQCICVYAGHSGICTDRREMEGRFAYPGAPPILRGRMVWLCGPCAQALDAYARESTT